MIACRIGWLFFLFLASAAAIALILLLFHGGTDTDVIGRALASIAIASGLAYIFH